MTSRSLVRRTAPWLLAGLVLSTPAFASGSYSPPGGRGDGLSRSRTDRLYEQGKALFRGQARQARGLEVCVLDAKRGRGVPVKRASLAPFRKRSANDLAVALVSCGSEPVQLHRTLDRRDLRALVHYLDKRHRLRLG